MLICIYSDARKNFDARRIKFLRDRNLHEND